jgi:hypothetical protein
MLEPIMMFEGDASIMQEIGRLLDGSPGSI